MRRRSKAGRKRKPGPRSPAGQRSRAFVTVARDFGTLELQIHRRALVGEHANTDLAASAIGRLLAHGCLEQFDPAGALVPGVGSERYRAAVRYATIASAVYGARWPTNSSAREISEADLLNLKRALGFLERWLSYGQRQILDKIVRADTTPTWLFPCAAGKPLNSRDNFEREQLLAALDAIRHHVRITQAAA
jgi:hypothetical protein